MFSRENRRYTAGLIAICIIAAIGFKAFVLLSDKNPSQTTMIATAVGSLAVVFILQVANFFKLTDLKQSVTLNAEQAADRSKRMAETLKEMPAEVVKTINGGLEKAAEAKCDEVAQRAVDRTIAKLRAEGWEPPQGQGAVFT